jgi:hypothetical protein
MDSGCATVGQQVPILANSSRKGPHPDKFAFDLSYLGDRSGPAGANDQPSTLANQRWVSGIAKESPRQSGVILSVQIDTQVDLFINVSHVAPPSSGE